MIDHHVQLIDEYNKEYNPELYYASSHEDSESSRGSVQFKKIKMTCLLFTGSCWIQ